MKKRLIATGEIVDVIGFRADKGKERDWEDYVHYKTSDTLVKGINGLNLYQDFEDVNKEKADKHIDWEQARAEAAIAAMKGILSNESIGINLNDESSEYYSLLKDIGKVSVSYADALIAELKKGDNK